MEDNSAAIEIVRILSGLEKRKEKLNKEIDEKRAELKSICIHNETEEKHEYIYGGYYDRAQYITIIMCKTCHTELSKRVTQGGYE